MSRRDGKVARQALAVSHERFMAARAARGIQMAGERKMLEVKLDGIRSDAKDLQQQFQEYSQGVQESILQLLKDAGIFDEVQQLEKDRMEVLQDAQKKFKSLQESADALVKAIAMFEPDADEKASVETFEAQDEPEVKAEVKPEPKAVKKPNKPKF
jgi:hypothetical protein